jgi:hypothetical protein
VLYGNASETGTTLTTPASIMTSTAGHRPLLAAANPLVSRFDGDRVTGLASVWRVEPDASAFPTGAEGQDR